MVHAVNAIDPQLKPMSVRLYKDSDRDRWNEYVVDSEKASCYHLIGWKNIIEKSFGHRTYYLLSEDAGGRVNGLVPLVQLKSVLFGNFAISLPFVNYGGIWADDPAVYDELLRELIKIARQQKMNHMELRYDFQVHADLRVKMSKSSMRLTLPEGKEVLWRAFPSKLRSQVQRPIKEKMYARIGKQDELENFYSVFSVNMRDLGTPVYSKRFFENILAEFPENTWICTVFTEEDNPVASGILLGFRETMEVPWASSLRAFNRFSPNMLLYWTILGFACDQGYRVFDFGRSTPDEGTYKFKAQWGAKPTQLYWYYWLRNGGPMPEINPHNPKYEAAIKLWQKLPLGLTKLIGPHIVKNLP